MTIQEFKEYVTERKPLSSDEIHQFMHDNTIVGGIPAKFIKHI